MRLSFAVIGSIALAVVIIGCSGGPAGPTLAPGQTATPAPATAPPGATATPAAPPVGSVCVGQPTFNANASPPTFAQDETLNSRFPTQVDGQSVTDIQSSFLFQSMCFYGAPAADLAAFAAIFPGSIGSQISSGNARVELDGDTIYIQAFRFPGADANLVFSHLPEFAAALGGDPTDAADSTVTTTNLGGKNVYVITDPDGDVNYGYVSGDVVWSVDEEESTAAKVFAALQ